MRKLTILLLGVGGNVSQGILKAIRAYDFTKEDVEVHVIGACISPESVGLYMCDQACISPYANDAGFLDWVIHTCNEQNVDLILTGVEENIIALQRGAEELQKRTKAVFVASPLEMLEIGQNKYLTCEWLKENGCHYPKYCRLDDQDAVKELVQSVGFPLIAKPCHGKGSGGVRFLTDKDALQAMGIPADYVLEECVGTAADEYTVGCYCDKNGQLVDSIVLHRRLGHGSTMAAEVVDDAEVRAEAEKICKAFHPGGPLNIQMRKDKDGRAVCFELNVRFSGTTPIRAHFGYQDVVAMIKEYCLGEEIRECFQVQKGVVYRYTNEFYMKKNPEKQFITGNEMLDMQDFGVEL